MAGDWIKMQKSLPRDPRVVRISSALQADRLRTVGGLLSAWCLFDEQTEDGILEGYTPELMDEIIGMPGLAMAMNAVGWLDVEGDSLRVPRFEEHNGQSAKRRAQDVVRKMSARKADKLPHDEQTKSGLEKRREEKSIKPPNPQGGFPFIEEIIPPNSSRLTKTEQKRVKVNRNTEQMVRIGKWFGQKETTLWTVSEYIALTQVDPSPEDMDLIGEHYSYEIPENGYRMTTISTLLNNWSKARAKAVRYFEENPELRSA